MLVGPLVLDFWTTMGWWRLVLVCLCVWVLRNDKLRFCVSLGFFFAIQSDFRIGSCLIRSEYNPIGFRKINLIGSYSQSTSDPNLKYSDQVGLNCVESGQIE